MPFCDLEEETTTTIPTTTAAVDEVRMRMTRPTSLTYVSTSDYILTSIDCVVYYLLIYCVIELSFAGNYGIICIVFLFQTGSWP